ncbi:MAG: ASKHA domain-containing protein [Lachnospiraceae bacterium]|nr:ASKHA domain-containing protein [Lachnospiraceae bacterium]
MESGKDRDLPEYTEYGIAFDLGSTTLAAYLCTPFAKKESDAGGTAGTGEMQDTRGIPDAGGSPDAGRNLTAAPELLPEGVLLAISRVNPQIAFGPDILSRVTYASRGAKEKKALSDILGDAVVSMTAELLSVYGVGIGEIPPDTAGALSGPDSGKASPPPGILSRILLVGNPVILGSVQDYPFEKTVREHFPKNTPFTLSDSFRAEFLPGIGNYVGADALAASYALEEKREGRTLLLIDIGTNAEIVLLRDDGNLATSVAAGPAMEGGNISCGMRGEPGAIDKMSLTELVNGDFDLRFHTIDEATPKGVCGSGLLSLLQHLLETGAIDNTGYLCDRQAALASGCPYRIAGRIEIDNTGYSGRNNARYFRLTDLVRISQEDIRELLLSISALRSGTELLLRMAGLTASELDGIRLAGAFGSCITVESALALGILPPIPAGKIRQCGNLAGSGAVRILLRKLSGEEVTDVINLRKSILTVQLANRPEFQELFYHYMTLPSRDRAE